MSATAHRPRMIVLGLLLIVVTMAQLAMTWFVHENRWTYFRAVHDAPANGQDPYEVARTCADTMAGEFLVPTLVSTACITALAAAIIGLAWRSGRGGGSVAAAPPLRTTRRHHRRRPS